jgi:hypothetical protein
VLAEEVLDPGPEDSILSNLEVDIAFPQGDRIPEKQLRIIPSISAEGGTQKRFHSSASQTLSYGFGGTLCRRLPSLDRLPLTSQLLQAQALPEAQRATDLIAPEQVTRVQGVRRLIPDPSRLALMLS